MEKIIKETKIVDSFNFVKIIIMIVNRGRTTW